MTKAPSDGGSPAPHRQRAVIFIFITVLLDIMALGLVAPILPGVVRQFVQGNTSEAAVIYGVFNAVFALMQFFCSPLIGCLSDRLGRRPLILASNIGLGLSYAAMAWAPSLIWLFIGRVLSGVTGASYAIANAYVADTTPPEKRAGAFGLLGAAFGVGLVLGPGIGGALGSYGLRIPLYVAAAFSLTNALYGLFVLPESLPKALRLPFNWRRANPIGALALLRRHPELTGLAGVSFLSTLAQVSLPSTIVLYATHRYNWSLSTLGFTLTVVGIALVMAQVIVVPRAIRLFGNRRAIQVGLLFGAAGMVIAGLAPTGDILWLGIPVLALWGIWGPAAQSLMTRHVSAAEQGQLQGATSSLTGISELLGPLIFPFVFAWFVRPGQPIALSGAPFLLAAAILFVAAVWAYFATRGELDTG